MNFFDLFKSKREKEIETLFSIFEKELNDFFEEKGFSLSKSSINKDNLFIDYTYRKESLFISFSLQKIGPYAMIMSGDTSKRTPYWDLSIKVGEGVSDFPESEWSSVNFESIKNKDTKDYNFTSIALVENVLDRLKNDIEQTIPDFLKGNPEMIIEMRIKNAEKKQVYPRMIQKGEDITYIENTEQLEFKEKYSKRE